MSDADLLVISDPGVEGSSLIFDLATSVSDNVIWLASEPAFTIKNIIYSHDYSPEKFTIFTTKQIEGFNFANLMNLNEISIGISKATAGLKDFSMIITILPELLLIHGLEKTYMFMLNTMWKIHNQNGKIFCLLSKGAQPERDEIIMARLFAIVMKLIRRFSEKAFERYILLETPVESVKEDVFPVTTEGYKTVIPPGLKHKLVEILK